MKSLGSISLNEIVFPVRAMALRDGQIMVYATLKGPLPAGEASVGMLYGEDGRSILSARWKKPVRWKNLHKDYTLTVELPIVVVSVEEWS